MGGVHTGAWIRQGSMPRHRRMSRHVGRQGCPGSQTELSRIVGDKLARCTYGSGSLCAVRTGTPVPVPVSGSSSSGKPAECGSGFVPRFAELRVRCTLHGVAGSVNGPRHSTLQTSARSVAPRRSAGCTRTDMYDAIQAIRCLALACASWSVPTILNQR